MKHRAFTLVEFVVCVLIICVLSAILMPVFNRGQNRGHSVGYVRRSTCQSNLKHIGFGLLQYVRDYDNTLPPARNATGGWIELTFPYIKSDQLFHCPADDSGNAPKTTDYFFNVRLSSLEAKALNWPAKTIVMGDGAGDSAPSYGLAQLPAAWRSDTSSPAWRHMERANYVFADGHVKVLAPDRITLDKPDANNPTFLPGGSKP